MVLCAWGGGELDPKTGKGSKKACLDGAEGKLLGAIEKARSGLFEPNRENDELIKESGQGCS